MCDGGVPTSCTGAYYKLNVTATQAPDGATAVTMSRWTRAVGTNRFAATFPPFSVTLVQLPPA